VGDSNLIDFRDVVARHNFAEHAERADRYFSTLDFGSAIARKPFAAPFEAAEICGGLSALLPDLLLFPGARVLDFGAGTCWMSRLLALLGCEVTAVDVSRKALEVGERLIRADALGDRLRVEFVPLDGPDLPFADGTFDRVVCFDALHHVPDQQRAVREFARVLKQGGIAALHEPGPRNSQSSQAQYEMRMYDVIEGDVYVEELIAAGRDAGFTDAELVVYSGRAIKTGLSGFDEFLASPGDSRVGRELVAQTAAGFENRRTVLLHKGDALAAIDSRSPLGLLADIDIEVRADDGHTHVRGTIVNTGGNTWLPSFGGIGAVNIGVHLHHEDGSLIERDYGRFRLSTDNVGPGQKRSVEMSIAHPEGFRRFGLTIDLVAEGITWFEIGGTTPARFVIILDEASPRVERM
jgi:SAM-dependent methyltransferase